MPHQCIINVQTGLKITYAIIYFLWYSSFTHNRFISSVKKTHISKSDSVSDKDLFFIRIVKNYLISQSSFACKWIQIHLFAYI